MSVHAFYMGYYLFEVFSHSLKNMWLFLTNNSPFFRPMYLWKSVFQCWSSRHLALCVLKQGNIWDIFDLFCVCMHGFSPGTLSINIHVRLVGHPNHHWSAFVQVWLCFLCRTVSDRWLIQAVTLNGFNSYKK